MLPKTRMVKYKVVKKFTKFLPEPNSFEMFYSNVPILRKGQFIVKALYISVDPYMRSFANQYKVPYDQFSFQVGQVVESKNSEYPKDMYVVSHSGWRNYTILNGAPDPLFHIVPYEPQIGDLPISLSIGALGMPGMTAYLGFLEICKPKPDDIVCVTSAAGAVGSLVCQIAKLLGCVVIGIVGSDLKAQIIQEEFDVDYAFNYKTETNIKEVIQEAVTGIDCFFDNVGGDLCATILQCMNKNGRVALCGAISTYAKVASDELPPIPSTVKVKPFSFTQWSLSHQRAALNELRQWIEQGTIRVKETVTYGFEELPNTFIDMLKGANIGKSIVKLEDDEHLVTMTSNSNI